MEELQEQEVYWCVKEDRMSLATSAKRQRIVRRFTANDERRMTKDGDFDG